MVLRNSDFDRLVSTGWFRRVQPPQPQPPQSQSPSTLNHPRKCSVTIVTLNHHQSPSHRLGIIIIITSIISSITLKKNELFQVSVIEPVEITMTLLDDHYQHVSPNKSNNALK